MNLSEREWLVLRALWETGGTELGTLVQRLQPETGWSRNTVLTYLTRMEGKGLVAIDNAYAASIPCGAGSGKLPRAGTKELRGAGLQRRDGGLDRGFFERREDHACGAGASAQAAG